MSRAFIVLSDGHIFEGERFGARGDIAGEIVFTTGMSGYIETLTDPNHYGQIVVQTFPLIGNCGMIDEDAESDSCHVRAYVVREWCETPSNFRAQENLDDYLKQHNIIGVSGVDTRELTRVIRRQGVMNAKITSELFGDSAAELAQYAIKDALRQVSTPETRIFLPGGEKEFDVVLIDCGVKRSLIRELTRRGCRVTLTPYDSTAERILAHKPDGIVLSNGPGDPAGYAGSVSVIRELKGKVPIFGVGLGHQLLALASGGKTAKLKCGHRGANQPVRDLSGKGDRVYITSQNHGYCVTEDGIDPSQGYIRFKNANDGTCEGIVYPGARAFSVQFYPGACLGSEDGGFLFDRFMALMRGEDFAER